MPRNFVLISVAFGVAMQFEIDPAEVRKAKHSHDLFVGNLIGNHVLWFVAALGIFKQLWQPVLVVPILSISILAYTIYRAKKSVEKGDSWFVMCHWQLAARRSKAFAIMLGIGCSIALLGWCGYTFGGMQKEAVMAMVGGVGLLPVMVTVLVLIVMEFDAMHQASHGRMPRSLYEAYPNPDARRIDADPAHDLDRPVQAP